MRKFRSEAAMLMILPLLFSCGGSKPAHSENAESDEAKNQRLDNLTTTVSRMQSRLEELDAKLSALSDKVEANRVAVDNVLGNKPLKTQVVGSAQAPMGEGSGTAPAEGPESFASMDKPVSEFTKAMGLFKAGKYSDAELAFNHFTEQFPEHLLAGSAQFYAGEAYLMMGEFKLALGEYAKVTSTFGSSPRVASAMVRASQCYEAMGNKPEAGKMMAAAQELFPGNPSLDWVSPVGAAATEGKGALSTTPIEPRGNAPAEPKPAEAEKK